jgi:hypothetical protein
MIQEGIIKIELKYADCDMQEIFINGKSIAFGNTWDIHGEKIVDGMMRLCNILGLKYEYEAIEVLDGSDDYKRMQCE